jgi:hypothetical protein
MAPPVAEALGVLLAEVVGLADDEEAELPPDLAAAWNASKLLAAVGLTAKTIPCWQCLKKIFNQYNGIYETNKRNTQFDGSRTIRERLRLS